MASKARRFYSKSSCAKRLIRTVTQERSTTPSRPRNVCYGLGVALEEVENTLNNNASAEYSDYEDFEFEEGRHSHDSCCLRPIKECQSQRLTIRSSDEGKRKRVVTRTLSVSLVDLLAIIDSSSI